MLLYFSPYCVANNLLTLEWQGCNVYATYVCLVSTDASIYGHMFNIHGVRIEWVSAVSERDRNVLINVCPK